MSVHSCVRELMHACVLPFYLSRGMCAAFSCTSRYCFSLHSLLVLDNSVITCGTPTCHNHNHAHDTEQLVHPCTLRTYPDVLLDVEFERIESREAHQEKMNLKSFVEVSVCLPLKKYPSTSTRILKVCDLAPSASPESPMDGHCTNDICTSVCS